MIQQGQVFKLTTKGEDGEPLWAYRYRLEGRSSARPQVGGFASRAEAKKALRKALDRVGPGHGGATTLAEFVEEYLELHQAEPVTIAKLRGEKRIADISPKDVYAWRLTVPEGHRFEATQALPSSPQPGRRLGCARLPTRRSAVCRTRSGGRRRSGRSSRGRRSRRSPPGSDRCTDRW